MLNKTPFVKLHGFGGQIENETLTDLLREAITQATQPTSQPQVVFKVTEADPETCIPQVSLYKLGKLEKVGANNALTIALRDDFRFDEAEEFQMRQLSSLTMGRGYQGNG